MKQKKQDYLGHRQRLRARFLFDLGAGFHDYELLELVLTQALPRGDVKPLAKELIRKFDDFAGVISASPDQLRSVSGVGNAVIVALKLVHASLIRIKKRKTQNRHIVSSWSELVDYCMVLLANETSEQIRLVFLDRKNRIMAEEVHNYGTADEAMLYPREVVKRALELNAHALVLVHNHPSGDVNPSKSDIQMTLAIRETVEKIGISLFDHLIIGRNNYTSFKIQGLL